MKKLIVKGLLNLLLLFSVAFSIYEGIQALQLVRVFPEGVTVAANAYRREAICFFLSALMQIIFIVFLDFFEVKFFKTSLLKEHKENKEILEEVKKQKRIEELEKQLNELKKNER